ncbi:ferrous iron transport protein B [Butyrivibrio hungatei]|uniref:Ferrous iron transport protein B n=1 Tax=Butyrivibrio hungatei TaxID=185008 RepID=A0A1G5ABZ0_9FIRM|nr:ferrous iron transport protein B [Butyrivibrio hungatei]SCX75371.1 ferrous iron transport protein B [Butyrivibrio hungatei]
MRIALAGNPNSGKTTMFNALTGRSEKIGNWAGVTVDKKESVIKRNYYDGDKELIAVDLPGAYSMSPFTSEESVTSVYVKNEHPDVIINIVDSTNLSRSLFFTTQLLELGIPVVVALNKNDASDKKGNGIDEKLLSEKLGCPVIKTIATSETGLKEVIKTAMSLAGAEQKEPYSQGDVNLDDKAAVEAADRERFEFVNNIVNEVESRSDNSKECSFTDAIDNVILHPAIGILIFAVIMWFVFYISQTTLGTWLADILAGLIDDFKGVVGEAMADADPLLYALIVDGIIGGVGAVVGFLPLVMVMYFLIALLEDCGYMARATVVLDPIFKKVGLSGKSAIPMIIGTGCGIPAVMACRTIRNERERRATAMLATFMPCGAKLPVIALFAGAFFPKSKWVSFICYIGGILLILLGALIIRAITTTKHRKSFFIIELPDYKVPSLVFALKSMLERGKSYIIKAGTVILVCNTAVQIMQTFNFRLQPVEEGMENTSILAGIAGPFAYILFPVVGIISWQLAAAAISGFIAKENVVGTIATVFAVSNLIDTEELELIGEGNAVAAVMGITRVAALAFLMFNLYTPPCFAALGAMNSEMKSKKWFWGAICFQLATGFTVGFSVYQLGTLFTTGKVGEGFIYGLIAIAAFAGIIIYLIKRNKKEMPVEFRIG